MSRPLKEYTPQRDSHGSRFQLSQEQRKTGGDWIYVSDPPSPDPTNIPAFQNGWSNVGGDDTLLRFRWLLDGEVEIEGHITGGADNTVVFTLPSPLYLRDKNLRVAGVTDDTDVAVFEIQLNGDVVYIGQATGPPPSGAAGGDLAGTYPNPTIANLAVQESNIDSDGASAGDVLTADGAGNAAFQPAVGGAPGGPAGGALDGTYPNPGIAASVAGAGLAESADVLSVNVDGSTIEIPVDTLQVKDKGITAVKIGSGAAAMGDTLQADGSGGASFAAGGGGATGPTGVTGVTGATGPSGPAGLDGLDGPVGPAGVTGPTGPAGAGGGSSVDSIDWPGPIGIQVDNSTIENPGGVLRVKDRGVTAAKLDSTGASNGDVATSDGSGGVAYLAPGAVAGGLSALFGNGDDGALSLTQSSAAPAWATKSGAGATTTFTLSRDIYATSIDFDDSAGNFLVNTGGFRIFCTGTFTIDAGVTVHYNGIAGGTGASGGGSLSSNTVGGSGAGGNGGSGGSGSNPTAITRSIATDQTSATTLGGAGGNEVGGGTGGGAAAGGQASNAATNGNPRNIAQALDPRAAGTAVLFTGGAGGGGGDATAGGVAGKGGSGGGVLAIFARKLINNGAIQAVGGTGGNGGGGGTGTGGGGGGQGGAIIIVYISSGSTIGTTSVAGGSGGTPTGTGANGGTGSSGLQFLFALS